MKKRATLLAAAILSAASPAAAGDIRAMMTADVTRVIDGQTLEVIAYPWPNLAQRAQVRVLDLHTPKNGSRAQCDHERTLARMASAAARDFLEGREIMLLVTSLDDFGRALAYVTLPDDEDGPPRDYVQLMLDLGLAQQPSSLNDWCE